MHVTTHQVDRYDITVPSGFDTTVATLESLVPAVDLAALPVVSSWDEMEATVAAMAPHGFLFYWKGDITTVMAGSRFPGRAVSYLMGNHVTAERMARHDPQVMLHAPLRLLVHTDPGDDAVTHVVTDRPSSYFGSYGRAAVADVGAELDRRVERLLAALGAPMEFPAHGGPA